MASPKARKQIPNPHFFWEGFTAYQDHQKRETNPYANAEEWIRVSWQMGNDLAKEQANGFPQDTEYSSRRKE